MFGNNLRSLHGTQRQMPLQLRNPSHEPSTQYANSFNQRSKEKPILRDSPIVGVHYGPNHVPSSASFLLSKSDVVTDVVKRRKTGMNQSVPYTSVTSIETDQDGIEDEDSKLFQEALELFSPAADELGQINNIIYDNFDTCSESSASYYSEVSTPYSLSHDMDVMSFIPIANNLKMRPLSTVATSPPTPLREELVQSFCVGASQKSPKRKLDNGCPMKVFSPVQPITPQPLNHHGTANSRTNPAGFVSTNLRVSSIAVSSDFHDFLNSFQMMMNDDTIAVAERFKVLCSPDMKLTVCDRPLNTLEGTPKIVAAAPVVSRSYQGLQQCWDHFMEMSKYVPDRFLSFMATLSTSWYRSNSLTVSGNFSYEGTFVGVVHHCSSDQVCSAGERNPPIMSAKTMLEQLVPFEEVPLSCKQLLKARNSDHLSRSRSNSANEDEHACQGNECDVFSPKSLSNRNIDLCSDFKVVYPFRVAGKVSCEVNLPTRKIIAMTLQFLRSIPS